MLKWTFGALALLSVVALLPSNAEARRYGSGNSGYVNTPFGPIPMSTMNQAGGNPFVAGQMREQQMYMQYQQQMMKQQQQYEKQMQQMQKAGQNPSGSMRPNSTSTLNPRALTKTSKKKKKPTTTTNTTVSTKPSTGNGATATDSTKKATTTTTAGTTTGSK